MTHDDDDFSQPTTSLPSQTRDVYPDPPHSPSQTSENSPHTVDSSTVDNAASNVAQATHEFNPWPNIPVDRMDINTLHTALSALSLKYSLVNQESNRSEHERRLNGFYSNAAGSAVSHLHSRYLEDLSQMHGNIQKAKDLISAKSEEPATECPPKLSELMSLAPAVALIGNIPVARVPKYGKGVIDRYWQTESSSARKDVLDELRTTMDVSLTSQEKAILEQEAEGGDQSDIEGLEEEWFQRMG